MSIYSSLTSLRSSLKANASGIDTQFCSSAKLVLPTVLCLFGLNHASAAIVFSYVENFDGMTPTGTTLPAGWQAGYLGVESTANRLPFAPYAGNGLIITNMPVTVYDGTGAIPTPNVGTLFNAGILGDSDRALVSYPRTTPSGDQVYQIAITNTSDETFNEINLSYAGEQWNQAQGTSSSGPEMIRLLVSTTSATEGFEHQAHMDFTAPLQGPGAFAALNGNDPANRVVVSGTVVLPTEISPGDTFYLRWHDWNDNGTSDHFIGIDDVSVTVGTIPEPTAATLCGLALVSGLARRRRTA